MRHEVQKLEDFRLLPAREIGLVQSNIGVCVANGTPSDDAGV